MELVDYVKDIFYDQRRMILQKENSFPIAFGSLYLPFHAFSFVLLIDGRWKQFFRDCTEHTLGATLRVLLTPIDESTVTR